MKSGTERRAKKGKDCEENISLLLVLVVGQNVEWEL